MEIKYTVATCSQQDVPVTALVAGKEVEVKASGLFVELVEEGGNMVQTLRLVPEDMAAALELFTKGETVVCSFNKPE